MLRYVLTEKIETLKVANLRAKGITNYADIELAKSIASQARGAVKSCIQGNTELAEWIGKINKFWESHK